MKDDIIRAAIAETVSDFANRFSKKDVAWGELHQVTFEHLMGKVWPLNLIFNRGPFPIDGGYSIVNNLASARADESFKVVHGQYTKNY